MSSVTGNGSLRLLAQTVGRESWCEALSACVMLCVQVVVSAVEGDLSHCEKLQLGMARSDYEIVVGQSWCGKSEGGTGPKS